MRKTLQGAGSNGPWMSRIRVKNSCGAVGKGLDKMKRGGI